MDLFLQLLIGGMMIGLTVIIHAIGLDYIIRAAPLAEAPLKRWAGPVWRPLLSSAIALGVFVVHIVEIWLWAGLYWLLNTGSFHSFGDILYFATVTFTTLGYGDIVLQPEYRMFSAVEGANGFLLFGWTTAFIFEIVTGLYRKEGKSL